LWQPDNSLLVKGAMTEPAHPPMSNSREEGAPEARGHLRKRDSMKVRAVLAEARLIFSQSRPPLPLYPRYDAGREFMLGITAAVEQRTLGPGQERVQEGLSHLKMSIRLFGTLLPGERSLSDSDEFHIATALQVIDW